MTLHPELRALIESGPLVHLSTINADGSPQVSVVWIDLEGDELVTAHMSRSQLKLRNLDRDPRAVLSFLAPPEPGAFLAPHAVLKATARLEGPTEEAWERLDRLAQLYLGTGFPAPRGAGWQVRYTVERVGGVGPWASR